MKQVVHEQNLFMVSQSMVFEVGCTPVQTSLTEGVVKSYCTSPWADMGVSIVMGVPQNGWFIRENPRKMDDDWGYPYFPKPMPESLQGFP